MLIKIVLGFYSFDILSALRTVLVGGANRIGQPITGPHPVAAAIVGGLIDGGLAWGLTTKRRWMQGPAFAVHGLGILAAILRFAVTPGATEQPSLAAVGLVIFATVANVLAMAAWASIPTEVA